MQCLKTFGYGALAAHCHHLEYSLLCAVVRVLGTSLTLCNPYVVVLLGNDEVHIVGQALGRHEHLAHRQAALYDERLVEANDVLHPW